MVSAPRPHLPLDRPISDDELSALLGWVLLYPSFNPTQDWLSLGEFVVNATFNDEREEAPFRKANDPAQLQKRVNERCWEWVRLGLIVPDGDANRFTLTERGRSVLSGAVDESLLLAPGGLHARLGSIPAVLPASLLFFAEEAQRSYHAGLYQASAVMIGVASEAVLVDLAAGLEARRQLFNLPRLGQGVGARQMMDWISEGLRQRRDQIRASLTSVGGTTRWLDDLPQLLGEANAIRLLRNDAGHPNEVRVNREEAGMLLLLFPRFAEAAIVTTGALSLLPPNS